MAVARSFSGGVAMHYVGYTVSQKTYHPTTNDNFNSSRPIPVIFGINIPEKV